MISMQISVSPLPSTCTVLAGFETLFRPHEGLVSVFCWKRVKMKIWLKFEMTNPGMVCNCALSMMIYLMMLCLCFVLCIDDTYIWWCSACELLMIMTLCLWVCAETIEFNLQVSTEQPEAENNCPSFTFLFKRNFSSSFSLQKELYLLYFSSKDTFFLFLHMLFHKETLFWAYLLKRTKSLT